jgi:hemolysin activation/secretion protein
LRSTPTKVLVSPEMFGIGGMNSVRGFPRARTGRRSPAIRHPWRSIPRTWRHAWTGRAGACACLPFYDLGRTSKVNPLPGETVHNGIASAGVGIACRSRKSSQPAPGPRQHSQSGRHEGGKHWRGSFAAVLSF